MSGTLQDAIADAGYSVPDIIMDGNIHRFATDLAKKHSKDGWYIGYDDIKGRAAKFGSWRDNGEYTWSNGTGRKLTPAELADIETKKAAARQEAINNAEQAAQRAKRILAAASETGESAYLATKKIKTPDGVRFVRNLDSTAFGFEKSWKISGIIVPLRNRAGDVRSLQIIGDGMDKKLFMPEGQTAGLFHAVGGDITSAERIVLAEGLATAQSCHESTGCLSVAAFSAGNLERVAQSLRALNARAQIIVAADGDDAGRKFAKIAADAVNGKVIEAPEGKDFNDVPLRLESNDQIWRSDLIVKTMDDGTQKTLCRAHNLILILSHAPEFSGRITFDEFARTVAIDGEPQNDGSAIRIKAQIERDWIQDKVPTSDVQEALTVVAESASIHPVKTYLKSLKWDRIPRIDAFFEDHLDCTRDPYHMAVARYLFLSAVSRIFRPGCKADMMVILESKQGQGKSTLWQTLAGEQWYADITSSINDKDFLTGLRGVWFADLGELDQFSKAESSRIKQVISIGTDHYRAHYARTHQSVPRQNIFVGGTNRDDYLQDATGARRMLPVKFDKVVDIAAVAAVRDQLWAEAVARFNAGKDQWWDVPNSDQHQADRYIGDVWEEAIQQYLMIQGDVSIAEVLSECLRIELGRQTRSEQIRVGNILLRLGWRKQRILSGSKRGFRYFKPIG